MDHALTDREADIMEILWKHGPSSVSDVQAALADGLAYTTVLTVLRTLESKGFVTHKAEGRAYRYAPLVARRAAQRSALRHLTAKLFQGSTETLLTQLVADRPLSPQAAERLRTLIARHTKEG